MQDYKIAALLEYDGSEFNGWQRQPHAPSVQAAVETAVSRVADHTVTVHCAGRTDAGVHALGQVIHFETHALRRRREWHLGINAFLPAAIAVLGVCRVPQDFHARFSARSRAYRYVIYNSVNRSALLRNRVAWERAQLDVSSMQQAADYLIGRHDFSSFRAVACQAKHPVRQVFSLTVTRHAPFIEIEVCADGFLYHMVRNMAGALIRVGKGERRPEWMHALLHAKDRVQGAITAPAQGLYLTEVVYDQAYTLDFHNNLFSEQHADPR